jgi:hypothetical protein
MRVRHAQKGEAAAPDPELQHIAAD